MMHTLIDQEPVVSIVIPSYNCAEWLRRSVASAVRFTTLPFEVVIVDDGSTDGSETLLSDLAQTYTELKLFRTQHVGVSQARNFGIERSVGRYIVFLDADDELIPLEQTDIFNGQLDIVRIGMEEVSAENGVTFRSEDTAPTNGRNYLNLHFRDERFYPAVCAYFYRREFLNAHGLRFPPGLLHEDMLFTVDALLEAQKVCAIPELTYRYFRRSSSITTDVTNSHIRKRLRSLSRISRLMTRRANCTDDVDIGWWSLDVIHHGQFVAQKGTSQWNRWLVVVMMVRFFLEYRAWGQYRKRRSSLYYLRMVFEWYLVGFRKKVI